MTRSSPSLHCDYCGLPVAHQAASDEPQYCCYGCRFAAAVMQSSGEGNGSEARAQTTRLGLALFFSMNVMVFTFFLWSEDAAQATASSHVLYELARYICLLISTPVLLLLGYPLAEDAIRELRQRRLSLNVLLLTGVAASFAYSAYSVFTGTGHVYFEVGCVVLVAVSLGRWLEASGKLKTTTQLRRLQNLLPDQVRLLVDDQEENVPLASIHSGDLLRILPGETIPADGTLARGQAAIDERLVTGESAPVLKQTDDRVYSGTTNLDGELLLHVTAAPGAGTMERLIDAVLQAVRGRTRLEQLAERLSQAFLPLVLVLAIATFAWHVAFHDLASGLLNALAVVVISCPCALGLATPMALWAAVGEATRRHILVRDSEAFSRLAQAQVFCFDKTGTLTDGCQVVDMQLTTTAPSEAVLAKALALARTSHHPLSAAIAHYAQQTGVLPAELSSVRSLAGYGVRGTLADTDEALQLGSAAWLQAQGIALEQDSDPPSAISSHVWLAQGDEPLACFTIRQRIRPAAREALAALRSAGVKTIILSGDQHTKAATIAQELGCEVQAPLLPEEKLAAIRQLQAQGQRVVMVGDGLNDAPALAAADVGIALGCGADVSRWSGSICLLNDDLTVLPGLVDLSRRTTHTIRWNLAWAFAYNLVCIPLAAAGWLHPAMAAGAMVASSLLVVSNSLRLTTGSDTPEESFEPPSPAVLPTTTIHEVAA